MKTPEKFYTILMVVLISLGAASCDKITEADTSAVEDDALAENLYGDILASVNDAEKKVDYLLYSTGSKKSALVDSCPVITVDKPDTLVWPKLITIDFGEGCPGMDDRVRTGMILIEITGRYRTPGATKTVTLVDYTVNGIAVEGVHSIVNGGRNLSGNFEYTVSLTGGKITLPDGKSATREFTRIREWVSGEATFNPWDDIYLITGSVTGVNFNGDEYLRTILEPLEADMACRFIKSGTIRFEVTGRPVFVIDYSYGDPPGGCDALAEVTREDGETRIITLRYRHRLFPR